MVNNQFFKEKFCYKYKIACVDYLLAMFNVILYSDDIVSSYNLSSFVTYLFWARLRGDLIDTFKILPENERVDSSTFSSWRMSPTVSESIHKRFKPRCCPAVRQNFFSLRIFLLMNGTRYQRKSWPHRQPTLSRTDWIDIGTIWASSADWLHSISASSIQYITSHHIGYSFIKSCRAQLIQATEWIDED